MEFAFATADLRGICESRRRAANAIGRQAARELERVLADLAAVATLAEFEQLFLGDLIERSPIEQAVRLEAGYDLVIRVGHVKIPKASSGTTDWSKVSRVRIVGLEATNG